MSLSTLNLELSVEQITDKYIESSNYFILRNSCINSSPIPFVTSEIKDQLSYILQVDQQESASHLTLAACKKQSQYDLDEQKRDYQESEDDSLLDTHLYFQLELIQEKIRSIETEIQQDNENIHCIQTRIKNIEEDEKTHHHHSHPETVDTVSKTSHEHPHPETVEQRDDKTHTHPEDDSHLKTPHAHSRVQHMHPETNLELQKNTLTKELSSLQKVLKSDQLRHQQLTESYDRVRENLLELTEKRQQRQMRAEVRNKRAVARLTDDPALLQLSEENRHLLKEAIETEHKKLHQKKEQLMQRAIEISYQTYLTRLEIYLQSTVSRNYQENEALKQIIQFMREYLLIIAEEQKIRLTRNNTFLEKEKIVKDKSQTEKKVEQLKQSNPALALQNISLGKENEQLEISIQERGSYKNTLLKIGLFFFLLSAGGACTGVTVAGGILAVTALFMVPAAVLAVIMLSLFIAALIYTIKNSIDSNQLTKNQTIIKDNIATISQQDSEMMLLESQILPELAKKISEAEHNLSMLDKSIERLHQHAELKLNTAKQVTVQFPSSQLPFIGQTSQRTHQDTYQNSIKTPTPFIDDLTERNAFTHQ